MHSCFVHNARRPKPAGKKGSRILRADPTRTTLIRRRFQAEMRRRFNLLKRHVWEFLVTKDALGLKSNPSGPASVGRLRQVFGTIIGPTVNQTMDLTTLAAPQEREFQFTTDAGKVKAFKAWLDEQIKADIFSVSEEDEPGKPWTAKYIESAYKKGKVNAFASSRSQLNLFEEDSAIQRASSSFIKEAFGQPERLSKVELLATRSFEELEGITAGMAQQMNRILANGMVEGSGALDVAREMSSTIEGITERRALVMARTEIIHAHAEGQLDTFKELGVEELGVQSEWSTAGDDRVCPECEKMEGKVFNVDEAHGMIPLHPNCRCTWIPHIPKHLLP